ncbi:MAG: tetratricopeptide repeat protein [Planctomycetota bacterium]
MPTIEQLEGILATDPDDAFMHYALALEYAKVHEHDKAVASFDRCLAIDPSYCYAYFHKAKTLEAAGNADEAIATLETGLGFARETGDQKALGEIGGYLEGLRVGG